MDGRGYGKGLNDFAATYYGGMSLADLIQGLAPQGPQPMPVPFAAQLPSAQGSIPAQVLRGYQTQANRDAYAPHATEWSAPPSWVDGVTDAIGFDFLPGEYGRKMFGLGGLGGLGGMPAAAPRT